MTRTGIQGIHHIAIKARDFERSLAFYTQGLGLTQTAAWGEGDSRAVLLDLGGGSAIELFAGAQDTHIAGGWMHLALRVEDCDRVYAAAMAAGAVSQIEPKDVVIPSAPAPMPVRIAFVTGPDGEVLEFFEVK